MCRFPASGSSWESLAHGNVTMDTVRDSLVGARAGVGMSQEISLERWSEASMKHQSLAKRLVRNPGSAPGPPRPALCLARANARSWRATNCLSLQWIWIPIRDLDAVARARIRTTAFRHRELF